MDSTRPATRVGIIAGGLALAALACSSDGEGTDTNAGAETGSVAVEATADGECLVAGGEAAAGFVDIEVANNSGETLVAHFSQLIEGATIDDVIAGAADAAEFNDLTDLAEFPQTAPPVDPGATATASVALTGAGDYAVSCATADPPVGVPAFATTALRVSDDGSGAGLDSELGEDAAMFCTEAEPFVALNQTAERGDHVRTAAGLEEWATQYGAAADALTAAGVPDEMADNVATVGDEAAALLVDLQEAGFDPDASNLALSNLVAAVHPLNAILEACGLDSPS